MDSLTVLPVTPSVKGHPASVGALVGCLFTIATAAIATAGFSPALDPPVAENRASGVHHQDALGNNAGSVSEASPSAVPATTSERERQRRRSDRYRLQDVARPFQVSTNAYKCSKVRHATTVEIQRRVEDGHAHFHGLVRCGLWHSCPVCAFHLAMHKAAEVRAIADAHREAGGALYLVTFTVPHRRGHRLRRLRRAVADAYRYVRTGDSWLAMKRRVSYVGEARALEVTVGGNGWHPHLHVLLFAARVLAAAELEELRAYYLRRWSDGVARCGYRAPSEVLGYAEHGVTIVESRDDTYLAKMGLATELAERETARFANELALGAMKAAGGKGRTPFEVLGDFAARRDAAAGERAKGSMETARALEVLAAADLKLWKEWVQGMYGARQLTWSVGLRKRYEDVLKTVLEKTDAEIVQHEGDEEAEEQVASIPGTLWDVLVRVDAKLIWQLLDSAESGGASAVEAMIARIVPRGLWGEDELLLQLRDAATSGGLRAVQAAITRFAADHGVDLDTGEVLSAIGTTSETPSRVGDVDVAAFSAAQEQRWERWFQYLVRTDGATWKSTSYRSKRTGRFASRRYATRYPVRVTVVGENEVLVRALEG